MGRVLPAKRHPTKAPGPFFLHPSRRIIAPKCHADWPGTSSSARPTSFRKRVVMGEHGRERERGPVMHGCPPPSVQPQARIGTTANLRLGPKVKTPRCLFFLPSPSALGEGTGSIPCLGNLICSHEADVGEPDERAAANSLGRRTARQQISPPAARRKKEKHLFLLIWPCVSHSSTNRLPLSSPSPRPHAAAHVERRVGAERPGREKGREREREREKVAQPGGRLQAPWCVRWSPARLVGSN